MVYIVDRPDRRTRGPGGSAAGTVAEPMMANTSCNDGAATMDTRENAEDRMAPTGERQTGTKKRKASPTDRGPSPTMEILRTRVEDVQTTYRTANDAVKEALGERICGQGLMRILGEAIADLVGVIAAPALNAWDVTADDGSLRKAETRDAATDTMLTPHWWESSLRDKAGPKNGGEKNDAATADDSDRNTDEEEPPRGGPSAGAGRRTYAAAAKRGRDDSSSEMDVEEGFRTVTRRTRRRKTTTGPLQRPTDANGRNEKPPAVMVKTMPGKSYAETVAAIKAAVNPADLGAEVRRIRRSAEGHTIVEFAKTDGAHEAAGRLREALARKTGEDVGPVLQMGNLIEAEIIDVDPTATKEEVIAALRDAATLTGNLPTGTIASAEITGLWPTKAGMQVATVKIPRAILQEVSRVRIGWTVARMRERAPAPTRCFRCHGFGHTRFACTGPDLSAACRRCGGSGHQENTCEAEGDRCVACERHGLHAPAHRTGSSSCPAWREALKRVRSGLNPRGRASSGSRAKNTNGQANAET